MKKILLVLALACMPASVYAESAFKFFPSSTTLNAPLTSTGTITLSNAGIVISTTTGDMGIRFQDGTYMNTADGVPTIINVANKSTSTVIDVITTNTNPAVCISTLTIVTSLNARLKMAVNATMEATNSVDHGFSFLRDGVPGWPITATDGMFDVKTPQNNVEFGFSFTYITDPLTDGTHNICLAIWTLTGTFKTSTNHKLQWYVHELK